ncbi:hypothetical protein [Actinorugispora endophytica]|uniref:Uncharacterized protein n=1 Tax=Actinorugispora endophytica TaxID=1605990 RepID=A0A4R6V133_9ACTN|nr:hypothetical protein [Actinorugispora endophytica]TDQ53745.1 hypothetical protein EV190_103196 [Actinorugispora endophytica]
MAGKGFSGAGHAGGSTIRNTGEEVYGLDTALDHADTPTTPGNTGGHTPARGTQNLPTTQ